MGDCVASESEWELDVETIVTDEDLLRTYESEQRKAAANIEPTALSKSVMAAFKRAKKASDKQNVRTREIIADLRRQREGTDVVAEVRKSVNCVQKTIFDFGR